MGCGGTGSGGRGGGRGGMGRAAGGVVAGGTWGGTVAAGVVLGAGVASRVPVGVTTTVAPACTHTAQADFRLRSLAPSPKPCKQHGGVPAIVGQMPVEACCKNSAQWAVHVPGAGVVTGTGTACGAGVAAGCGSCSAAVGLGCVPAGLASAAGLPAAGPVVSAAALAVDGSCVCPGTRSEAVVILAAGEAGGFVTMAGLGVPMPNPFSRPPKNPNGGSGGRNWLSAGCAANRRPSSGSSRAPACQIAHVLRCPARRLGLVCPAAAAGCSRLPSW